MDYGTMRHYPLSLWQKQLFDSRNSTAGIEHNQPRLFHLDSDVDIDRYAHAWRMVIDIHGSVKTRFDWDDSGNLMAVVDNDLQPNVRTQSMTATRWLQELQQLVRPFDLDGDDDLYRIVLYTIMSDDGLREQDKFLFIDFHSAIADTRSLLILLSGADDVYHRGNTVRETIAAPALVAENNPDRLQRAREWIELFYPEDISSLPKPDINSDQQSPHRKASLTLDLKSSQLRHLAASFEIEPQTVLAAALGLVVGKTVGKRKTIFALLDSGRQAAELEYTVGHLERLLPVLCNCGRNMTVEQYLKGVQAAIDGARDCGDVDFHHRLPNFDSLVMSVTVDMAEIADISQFIDRHEAIDTTPEPQPPLAFTIANGDDGLSLICRYHSGQYSNRLVAQMLMDFDSALNGLAQRRMLTDVLVSDTEPLVLDNTPTPAPAETIELPSYDEEREAVVIDDWNHDIATYDYSSVQAVLDENTLDAFLDGANRALGDVLLTGATGFLGAHVLHRLLSSGGGGHIYCLLRPHEKLSAVERLKSTLFYYFEDAFDEVFDSRLTVIEGDITERIDVVPRVDTVFNCAAELDHIGGRNVIERINVDGVNNLIYWCLGNGATLVQVSTLAAMGYIERGTAIAGEIDEQRLYFGQYLGNDYVRTKFLAERLILEAVDKQGLSAKIMRVGVLAPRYRDGEFKINFGTSAAMGVLKAFSIIGACPFSMLDNTLEFTPVDDVSRAMVMLAGTPERCRVFHLCNHHRVLSIDVFNEMSRLGLVIRHVEDDEFEEAVDAAVDDMERGEVLERIVAFENLRHRALPVELSNRFTMQVLYRLGFAWSVTSWDYIKRFIAQLQGLGFFDLSSE